MVLQQYKEIRHAIGVFNALFGGRMLQDANRGREGQQGGSRRVAAPLTDLAVAPGALQPRARLYEHARQQELSGEHVGCPLAHLHFEPWKINPQSSLLCMIHTGA